MLLSSNARGVSWLCLLSLSAGRSGGIYIPRWYRCAFPSLAGVLDITSSNWDHQVPLHAKMTLGDDGPTDHLPLALVVDLDEEGPLSLPSDISVRHETLTGSDNVHAAQ
ncbi:hypothetical protein EVG20_g3121 [Dentipellis fragilis]|uniref:Endonuclease/exonuclease/phosphatase domain-containing protein n=1 Tax=Dentipellis fragilis TaxID=205917 RepID=A0A4Y9Z6U2_9AGAM|nr:hypothetical protein EVG20_g3121 [Dentipellis fragilis]